MEYATDEQRNVICESVAQDLVNISLNMHGTRAVQKMIEVTLSKQCIHFLRSDRCPPTSNMCILGGTRMMSHGQWETGNEITHDRGPG